VNSAADSIIPETYDRWPRSVQLRYLQELYALYFPERVQQGADVITPQPKGSDIADAGPNGQ
jgi:hypothetical protein